MSEWQLKRFWKETSVAPAGDGFTILLDGRNVKTPAKALLAVPTEALAEAIAAEWDAQEGVVDPNGMPLTRTANSAIDKVAHQRADVADMLAAYGDSDLLCYRAEAPEALVARQAEQWDPPLGWAESELGVRLEPRTGVMHSGQEPEALARLAERVHAMPPFELAAFHDLVSLTGSLVLGFAAAMDWRDAGTIWAISRLDELWQEEQWGEDSEATATAEIRARAFADAKIFYDLVALPGK